MNLRYNAAATNKSMADGRFRTKIWCQTSLYLCIAKTEKRTAKKAGSKEMISNKEHRRHFDLLGPEIQPPLAISWGQG